MKQRSIGGLVLVLAIVLGGCAPPDAGASGGTSDSAAPAPTQADEY